MGPVHGVTVCRIAEPTLRDPVVQALATSFAIVTIYIGQALSLKASAVGSVDHYERNERARDIIPSIL